MESPSIAAGGFEPQGDAVFHKMKPTVTEPPRADSPAAREKPTINIASPDSDTRHGWSRGMLRLVVDRLGEQDIIFERDLALCLEKPANRPG